jgi:hypothetical protein
MQDINKMKDLAETRSKVVVFALDKIFTKEELKS